MASKVLSAVQSLFDAVRGQVAGLAEARVFSDGQVCPGLLRGLEGARLDGGLYVGDEDLDAGFTMRTLGLIRRLKDRGDESALLIVPFDNKSHSALGLSYARVAWRFDWGSHEQRDTCQFVILTSAKDPHYAAILPMHYYRERGKKMGDTSARCSDSILPRWTVHPLPAFSGDMAPYMVPLSTSGRQTAFDNIRSFAQGRAQHWVNDHTGVVFHDVPRPDLHPVSVLEPAYGPWIGAGNQVRDVAFAFQEYSRPPRRWIEFVDVFPINGDFKILGVASSEEIFVESKTSHCSVTRHPVTKRLQSMHHSQHAVGCGRAIFHWKAPWDFIYTHVAPQARTDEPEAFLIPRDLIPPSWWDQPDDHRMFQLGYSTNRKLVWPREDLHILEELRVATSSGRRTVEDIERILANTEQRAGSAKTRRKLNAPTPLDELPDGADVDDEDVDGMDIDDADNVDAEGVGGVDGQGAVDMDVYPDVRRDAIPMRALPLWDTMDMRRGFGSAEHDRIHAFTYEQWAFEALTEVCRKWGSGLIQDLGRRNKRARYIVHMHPWTAKEIEHYDRTHEQPLRAWHLHKTTLVVPVTFIRLGPASEFGFQGSSNSEWTAKELMDHRATPCLFICDAFPFQCIRQPHGRFVIPSGQLPVDFVRRSGDRVPNAGLWDQYLFDEDKVMDGVLAVIRHEHLMKFGSDGLEIRPQEYFCKLQDVLQSGIDDWAFTFYASEQY
ncbi:MAG: hypothetical protein Q9170_001465 [Blastenia crenularia]